MKTALYTIAGIVLILGGHVLAGCAPLDAERSPGEDTSWNQDVSLSSNNDCAPGDDAEGDWVEIGIQYGDDHRANPGDDRLRVAGNRGRHALATDWNDCAKNAVTNGRSDVAAVATARAQACPQTVGGWDYCRPDCPCQLGEGDCDSDSDCAPGHVCMRDMGELFGWDAGVDVCMDVCPSMGTGTPDYCSDACPCQSEQGDCDSDSECVSGAVCIHNVGASFGFPAHIDVCIDSCDEFLAGTWDYCSETCLCEHGQGDCDSDLDCVPGAFCASNIGAEYGYDEGVDICVAVAKVVTGWAHSCALLSGGEVRCWGQNDLGQLGYGHTEHIGDDEEPASAGNVDVGGRVVDLVAGNFHTCALLDTHAVRCWGYSPYGQLGYGGGGHIGDDEVPAEAGDVDVGGPVVALTAGSYHTCALLEGGAVRCWGRNYEGQLGYGNTTAIGDNETPASAGNVDIGGPVFAISAGGWHTCARLYAGKVRCWGNNSAGQLGYGNDRHIGDNETPASAGDVDVGGPVTALSAGGQHTCAILAAGRVRCWGNDQYGQLGYGFGNRVGDNESPASAGDVDVSGRATVVHAGYRHTCATLDNNALRCWGYNRYGQLGYGDTDRRRQAAKAGDVDVGSPVTGLSTGGQHTCAQLSTGKIRCWGGNWGGQLGYSHTDEIGDDETPAQAGDVPLYW
ncbi:MAG: hypothetical protein MJE77_04405 [Proteobacteria bacterium]|nr:hypothetical protein [Pseudomonadota bacterium]